MPNQYYSIGGCNIVDPTQPSLKGANSNRWKSFNQYKTKVDNRYPVCVELHSSKVEDNGTTTVSREARWPYF